MSCRHPREAALVRLGGWVHLGRSISGLAVLVSAGFAFFHQDAGWLSTCGLCGLVWTVFALLHAFETNRLRCQHCEEALFQSPPGAGRLPRGHSLRTAAQAAFRSHYRCQHCGHESQSGSAPASWRPREIVLHTRIPKRR